MDQATIAHLREVLGDLSYHHKAAASEVEALKSRTSDSPEETRAVAGTVATLTARVAVHDIQIAALTAALETALSSKNAKATSAAKAKSTPSGDK